MLLPQRFELDKLPVTNSVSRVVDRWRRAHQVLRVGSRQVTRQFVYRPRIQRPKRVLNLFDALGLSVAPPGLEAPPAAVAKEVTSQKKEKPKPQPPTVAALAPTLNRSVRVPAIPRAEKRGGPARGRSAPPRSALALPSGFELYAGSGRITGALAEVGVCVRLAMEIEKGKWADIHRPRTLA